MKDCEDTPIANELCRTHYNRQRRYGSTDPRPDRRAQRVPCARSSCENTVVDYKKYCSPYCYHADPDKRRSLKRKPCHHCDMEYTPVTPNQHYCLTCLGPPVSTSKHGSVKYEGMVRLRLYNLSHPEWLALLAAQGGRCAICGTDEPGGVGQFHVDHDHACCPGDKSCGKCIRGLLCHSCNVGIGCLGEGVERLMSAAAYLLSRQGVLGEVAV